jgi:hypothetical protein
VISFLNKNPANFSFQITNQLTNSTISSGGEIHSKGETGESVEPTPYLLFSGIQTIRQSYFIRESLKWQKEFETKMKN